jgi:hypothetical protein
VLLSEIASSYPQTSPKTVLIVAPLASGYTRKIWPFTSHIL